MFGLGLPELLVILLIVLLLFGASRVPELMSGLGKGITAFRKGLRDDAIDVTPSAQGGSSSEESEKGGEKSKEKGRAGGGQ